MAITDIFLKLDKIDGESVDHKHKGEIDIDSFSWGVSQTGTSAYGGGGGAGKASFGDLTFTAKTNKSSPKLMLSCASGTHIAKAVLTVRKAGKEQQEYYIVTLTDTLITSFQSAGHGDAGGGGGPGMVTKGGSLLPVEAFSLNYAKIEFQYCTQKADGSLDAKIVNHWDLKQNKGG